jgi:hypothetical protein
MSLQHAIQPIISNLEPLESNGLSRRPRISRTCAQSDVDFSKLCIAFVTELDWDHEIEEP